MSKTQKRYGIKTLGESKLNSIKDLISKALQDGQISESEFRMVLCELEKNNDLKDKTGTKQSGLSEAEKNKLIQEVKRRLSVSFKKSKIHIILFNKFISPQGVQSLSGRVLDSRPRGRGFEPHQLHCVVVLEQDTFILA